MHHTWHGWLHRQPAIVARQGNRPMRSPMVRTVTRQDLIAAGIEARHLDRVLIRLSSPQAKECFLQVARGHLGNLLP